MGYLTSITRFLAMETGSIFQYEMSLKAGRDSNMK